MSLPQGYKAQKGTAQEFEPIPEGIYQVEISNINAVQKPKFRKPDEMEEVLDFEFTILDEGEAKARRLWKKIRPFVVVGDKPSYLYQIMLKATLQPDLSEDDALAIEIPSLIGKQIVVMVDRKKGGDGKVYNNITAFSSAKASLDPVEKSEAPRAGEDRETTIKAIFATAKKLYPTLSAATSPKDALKDMVERDFSLKVESWSKASVEQLNEAYRAMKNLEAQRVTATLDTVPQEGDINIEDIPF